MEFLTTPIQSTILVVLTSAYFLVASISTYDIRIIQAIKDGQNLKQLPNWISIFHWLLWLIWISIFILNWYYGLILFGIKFILKVIPVLEIVGSFLLIPFDPNNKKKHKYKKLK